MGKAEGLASCFKFRGNPAAGKAKEEMERDWRGMILSSSDHAAEGFERMAPTVADGVGQARGDP
jgi:hypothetical protein